MLLRLRRGRFREEAVSRHPQKQAIARRRDMVEYRFARRDRITLLAARNRRGACNGRWRMLLGWTQEPVMAPLRGFSWPSLANQAFCDRTLPALLHLSKIRGIPAR